MISSGSRREMVDDVRKKTGYSYFSIIAVPPIIFYLFHTFLFSIRAMCLDFCGICSSTRIEHANLQDL